MADSRPYVFGWHPDVPDEHGLSADSLRGTPEVIDLAPRDRSGKELERAPLSYYEARTLDMAGRGSEIPLDQFGTPHGEDAVSIGLAGVRPDVTPVSEPVSPIQEDMLGPDDRAILALIPDARARNEAARKMVARNATERYHEAKPSPGSEEASREVPPSNLPRTPATVDTPGTPPPASSFQVGQPTGGTPNVD